MREDARPTLKMAVQKFFGHFTSTNQDIAF